MCQRFSLLLDSPLLLCMFWACATTAKIYYKKYTRNSDGFADKVNIELMVKHMLAQLINNLCNRQNVRSELLHPKEYGYIYEEHAFCDILRRECARSDRNGHSFTLAVIRLPETEDSDDSAADDIVDLVGDRLRVTDQAGWLERNRCLAVLLYACDLDAARGYVERIQADCHGACFKYDLYYYPDPFFEALLAEQQGSEK